MASPPSSYNGSLVSRIRPRGLSFTRHGHGLIEDPTWSIGGYPETAETFTRAALALQMRAAPL